MISVVIPLYNKELSIKSCIDSVLNQNYLPAEIIIVDDGSTDDSLEVLNEFLLDNLNSPIPIKVVEQKNHGVSHARNKGVSIAKGDFIAFLDADDLWESCFLQDISILIASYPKAVLYTCRHKIYKEGFGYSVPFQSFGNEANSGIVVNFFKESSKGSEIVNSSKVVIRKSTFLHVGGFPIDAILGEDLFLWIQLALEGDFAFTAKVNSLIIVKSDLSRHHRVGKIPYPIVFYGSQTIPKNNKYIIKYLWRLHKVHVLGSLADGNKEEAILRIKAGNKIFVKSYLFYLLILVPSVFFWVLKKLKNWLEVK